MQGEKGDWTKGHSITIRWEELEEIGADGSLRRFYRWGKKGLILIVPQRGPMGLPEQKAYVAIGRHLSKKGVAVPRIRGFDETTGLILVEDLGEESLFELVKRNATSNSQPIRAYYEDAVRTLVTLNLEGREGFDPTWCHDTPYYDGHFAAKREALYFSRFFLKRFIGMDVDPGLEDELIGFAHAIDSFPTRFLLHRDFQSRNLFIKDEKVYVIDFQGAMLGPLFYDLAALLYDPYVDLEDALKKDLFELYVRLLRDRGMDREIMDAELQFKTISLFRLLQVLGAYSFLSIERKRPFFKKFIPVALERLKDLLIDETFLKLPRLKHYLSTL